MSVFLTTWRAQPVLVVLALLWVVLLAAIALLQPQILNSHTFTSILQFASILALVSLGQSLIILAGGAGIDLSVGGNVSLSAVLTMMAIAGGLDGAWMPALCVAIGGALGLANGILVTRLGFYPLIVTLGTFYVYSGVALALTGGAAIPGVPAWSLPWGRGSLGPVPWPFLTLVLPGFLLAFLVLSFTSWGRWIYAMGFNERSARLVGIPVDRVRVLLYTLGGMLSGLAALISLAWLGSARPNVGVNLELESLTAAMLGGVAIFGGRGHVFGVFAAVVLLVTLKTAMLQMGFNTVLQVGVVGLLLILVLLADRLSQTRG
ncbi:ABC transporter permease [Chelativorans sp. AA-79]|uniref:ABC transporter permease n=1 Tax=Chelativorans sp. AA-79 TaxID=3028735 RepID=UPI0023F6C7C9|nr:ABC transporter permease [Chelativorans sp. AA-79]WEX08033.1 ABC transporter permease [Chelativorans sp. AA-79]